MVFETSSNIMSSKKPINFDKTNFKLNDLTSNYENHHNHTYTTNTNTHHDMHQQDEQYDRYPDSIDYDNGDYSGSTDDLSSNSVNLLMQSQESIHTFQTSPQQPLINRCNEANIISLIERTGYPIVQENGQRKYGPPPNWKGIAPNRGCEIFVGKIPRDCFEDELVPTFEKIGRIYEVRLMMDFNGYNRGYAFVMYTNRDDAKKAVKELNNYEIRKGRLIGVCHSVDNCRLFVGGIPKNKKKEEIMEEIKKVTEFVKDVIVYPSAHDKTKNRGFAFVEYENHKAAAMARRKLLPGRIQLWGHQIAVDWAEPETEVDEDIMAGVRILYVRNLMLSTTEEQIKAEFEKIKKGSIERVKKLKDYAFVHFKEREDAENAKNILDGQMIDGSVVEITFAKPVDKNNYIRFTRGVISPTSQLAGAVLAPAPMISNHPAAIHLASFAPGGAFTHLANLPIIQSQSGNTPSFQRIQPILPHPSQFGGAPIAAPPEFVKFAHFNGMELPLVQLNPMPIKIPFTETTQPWQILEEVCLKQALGSPIYTLHTADGRDAEGREVPLYLYKIVIPGYLNGTPIAPKILSCSVEEAKNVATEHALNQLGIQMTIQQIAVNDYFNQPPIPQSPTSIYQNRTLPSNQNTQNNSPNPTIIGTVNPVSNLPNTTMPLIAAPYFIDPATQCMLTCQPANWQI